MGVGWPHRLACVTAGATVGLIVAGGLVTNTGAALAVPDWPTTFGHNPFLFPWSGMVGGVLVEHGHRLLGSLIGLLTVGLAVALGFGDPRRWVRGLGLLAVVLVSMQGLIGGLRVVLLQDVLGLVHGCLAQLFFALLVGIGVVTGRAWRTPAVVPAGAERLAAPGRWAAVVVYGQIVLGAFTTHGTAVSNSRGIRSLGRGRGSCDSCSARRGTECSFIRRLSPRTGLPCGGTWREPGPRRLSWSAWLLPSSGSLRRIRSWSGGHGP